MTREAEKEVKVVEGFDTMTGTEVVNVVKLELREMEEEVALAGTREVDHVKLVGGGVGAVEGMVGGIAEDAGWEDGDEGLREAVVGVCVGRKVEPLPAVRVFGGWERMDMVSSLAGRGSRGVK